MPTYEYYCDDCNFDFELLQSIKSEPFSNCPKCNKKLERKISAPAGIVFKGSGFYITDYKKSNSINTSSSGSNQQAQKISKDKEKGTDTIKQEKTDSIKESKDNKVEKKS
jgi:putative FmdB family regulatory protein